MTRTSPSSTSIASVVSDTRIVRVLCACARPRTTFCPLDDGVPGGILLFVDEGRLSYLEYVYYGLTSTQWPRSDRISVSWEGRWARRLGISGDLPYVPDEISQLRRDSASGAGTSPSSAVKVPQRVHRWRTSRSWYRASGRRPAGWAHLRSSTCTTEPLRSDRAS